MASRDTRTSRAFRDRHALIDAAVAGDAAAQCRMGDLCREGDALTDQDDAEAAKWYRLAAEQGSAVAQNNLGSMYLDGMGVRPDAREATKWYRLAAAQGLAVAQYNLGVRYRNGDGADLDLHEAARWMRAAAEAGDELAENDWGVMLRFGHGVTKDVVSAGLFLLLAARRGDVTALANVGDVLPELEAAALAGSDDAAWFLDEIHAKGLGVAKNLATAQRWVDVIVARNRNGWRTSYYLAGERETNLARRFGPSGCGFECLDDDGKWIPMPNPLGYWYGGATIRPVTVAEARLAAKRFFPGRDVDFSDPWWACPEPPPPAAPTARCFRAAPWGGHDALETLPAT